MTCNVHVCYTCGGPTIIMISIREMQCFFVCACTACFFLHLFAYYGIQWVNISANKTALQQSFFLCISLKQEEKQECTFCFTFYFLVGKTKGKSDAIITCPAGSEQLSSHHYGLVAFLGVCFVSLFRKYSHKKVDFLVPHFLKLTSSPQMYKLMLC